MGLFCKDIQHPTLMSKRISKRKIQSIAVAMIFIRLMFYIWNLVKKVKVNIVRLMGSLVN